VKARRELGDRGAASEDAPVQMVLLNGVGDLRLVGSVEAIASAAVGEFGQAEAGVRPRSFS
jgi:hypothetical protein